MSQTYHEPEAGVPTSYRVVKAIAWILLFLGLLEWFVLGANRPEDPVVSPIVGVIVPLVVGSLVR